MVSKRIKWLDFARGITILGVVCTHGVVKFGVISSNPSYLTLVGYLLFMFIMPCFFAISGYLYKHILSIKSYLRMIYKKLISIGIPYILFSILYVIMQNSSGNNLVTDFHSYGSLLKIYSTPIDYLWFLYALFLMFLIIGTLDLLRINFYIQFILSFVLMIISNSLSNVLSSGLQLTFNDLVFFYLGVFVASNIRKPIINRMVESKKILAVSIVTFIVLIIISYNLSHISNTTTLFNILTKIVSVIVLIQVSINIPNNKLFRYFCKYGKMTLIIYLVHEPIISIMRDICIKIMGIQLLRTNLILLTIIILLGILVAWYLSILICYLARKITLFNFIFYPRKKYISKLMLKSKLGKWLFDINN